VLSEGLHYLPVEVVARANVGEVACAQRRDGLVVGPLELRADDPVCGCPVRRDCSVEVPVSADVFTRGPHVPGHPVDPEIPWVVLRLDHDRTGPALLLCRADFDLRGQRRLDDVVKKPDAQHLGNARSRLIVRVGPTLGIHVSNVVPGEPSQADEI
jgi:hypothetical protein